MERTVVVLPMPLRPISAKTCPAATLSVEALLNHDHIIMTESAVRQAEALWGGDRATTSRGKGA